MDIPEEYELQVICAKRHRKAINKLKSDNKALREALVKAREDINWMLNNKQFLNAFVFDYIDNAIDNTK